MYFKAGHFAKGSGNDSAIKFDKMNLNSEESFGLDLSSTKDKIFSRDYNSK